ncbi:MAG TPA: hypothetical protein PKA27_09400 [Fimbriimonadaceae bacterium]|nr:hypothetical protein [Fimbriimonadaceae bacterium]
MEIVKKSAAVPAALIIAVASTITATGCSPRRECRDAQGNLLPDTACRGGTAGARWVSVQSGGFGNSGAISGS